MIVSLTIIRYRKLLIPFALLAMAIHRLPMRFQKGRTFWRLLGCGRNGTFDLNPDWQQWGLLAVWNSREDFDRFYEQSFVARWWNAFGAEKWTILCTPLQSHGKWDGKEPFGNLNAEHYQGPVVILTRATIRLNRLKNFWANVDEVAELMRKAPGYIFSLGVGERPFYKQATFSMWDSLDNVKAFAYQSKEHTEVIKKTRSEGWYSEELFARFKPIASMGTLNNCDPLKGLITASPISSPKEGN
jgi:heme-degrading monooxygenase HmoA